MIFPISPTPIVEVENSQRQSQADSDDDVRCFQFSLTKYASRILMESIGLYKMCNARMMFLSHSVIRL